MKKLTTSLQVGTIAVALACGSLGATEPGTELDLVALAESQGLTLFNREAAVADDGGRAFVRLDGRQGSGAAWLNDVAFLEGTIEITLRGRDVRGGSFIGLAYHATDDETYEAIYFRPFNFRAEDPARRAHALQYIAHPEHTWHQLRKVHPGQYENPIAHPPEADAWFHARIDVSKAKVRVFVNGAEQPSLEVTPLRQPKAGRIGLWVGNGSPGDFKALSLTPATE